MPSVVVLHECSEPNAHRANICRPGGVKADRCFFCPETVESVEYVKLDDVLKLLREHPVESFRGEAVWAANHIEHHFRKGRVS